MNRKTGGGRRSGRRTGWLAKAVGRTKNQHYMEQMDNFMEQESNSHTKKRLGSTSNSRQIPLVNWKNVQKFYEIIHDAYIISFYIKS